MCQMTVGRDADVRPRQPNGLRCTYRHGKVGVDVKNVSIDSLDTFVVEFN